MRVNLTSLSFLFFSVISLLEEYGVIVRLREVKVSWLEGRKCRPGRSG